MSAKANPTRSEFGKFVGLAYLAKALIEKIVPEDESLAESVYVAGVWHDMGKIDGVFQDIPDDGEHIGKKGLAYVTNIDTREVKRR